VKMRRCGHVEFDDADLTLPCQTCIEMDELEKLNRAIKLKVKPRGFETWGKK